MPTVPHSSNESREIGRQQSGLGGRKRILSDDDALLPMPVPQPPEKCARRSSVSVAASCQKLRAVASESDAGGAPSMVTNMRGRSAPTRYDSAVVAEYCW